MLRGFRLVSMYGVAAGSVVRHEIRLEVNRFRFLVAIPLRRLSAAEFRR
jgi:hypothetical protein